MKSLLLVFGAVGVLAACSDAGLDQAVQPENNENQQPRSCDKENLHRFEDQVAHVFDDCKGNMPFRDMGGWLSEMEIDMEKKEVRISYGLYVSDVTTTDSSGIITTVTKCFISRPSVMEENPGWQKNLGSPVIVTEKWKIKNMVEQPDAW